MGSVCSAEDADTAPPPVAPNKDDIHKSLGESAMQHQLGISEVEASITNIPPPPLATEEPSSAAAAGSLRRESAESGKVSESGAVRLEGSGRPRGLSRRSANGGGRGGGSATNRLPPAQTPRTDAAAFRTVLSFKQVPLGPPRTQELSHPHAQASDTYLTETATYTGGGLQALLKATMDRDVAMRRLAHEKLPELHLLGSSSNNSIAAITAITAGGNEHNNSHTMRLSGAEHVNTANPICSTTAKKAGPKAAALTRKSRAATNDNDDDASPKGRTNANEGRTPLGQAPTSTLLASALATNGAGAAITPNSAPRRQSQDEQAPLSVIECTVEPPSCPNDLSIDATVPVVLSEKDVIALRPPRHSLVGIANPLLSPPTTRSAETSTTSGGTTSHRFSIHNPMGGSEGNASPGGLQQLQSWSSPATLYAQSSGGIPSMSARPSVSDAFGSQSQLTSRQSTMSSRIVQNADGQQRADSAHIGSQNPLGIPT